jgi:hypothetical protein
MTSQLSWQPPMPAPVNNCRECPKRDIGVGNTRVCTAATPAIKVKTYEQNTDGITPTCPMYQQQNKESK